MLNIAFLAPRLPWPLDTGGKIRTYHLLAALARRHRVTLLSLQGEEALDGGMEQIRQLGVAVELFAQASPVARATQLGRGLAGPLPYNLVKYQSPRLRRRLRQLCDLGLVDLVHCDHVHMAPHGQASGRPFIVDEHNVETVIWRRFARDRSEPLAKRLLFAQQAWHLERAERTLCREASLVLLCSAADRDALDVLAGPGAARGKVVPNGVDVEYFGAGGEIAHGGHLFFTGSMDWAPNENAVTTFLDEIWPEVSRRLPGTPFVVVGRNPSASLRQRHGLDSVQITGTVPDVRPHMRGALALMVPMRVGGGTRLKILEAFAASVPVISTAVGIEGIEATPGEHYLQAESARDFAHAAARLTEEAGLARALTLAARALVMARYSWRAIGDDLAEAYAELFGDK